MLRWLFDASTHNQLIKMYSNCSSAKPVIGLPPDPCIHVGVAPWQGQYTATSKLALHVTSTRPLGKDKGNN